MSPNAGETVNVEAGTFVENVTIGKDIDILGDAAGGTTVSATSGNVFEILAAGVFGEDDDTVSLDFINLDGDSQADGDANNASFGVLVRGNADLANFSLTNASVSNFRNNGFIVDGSTTTGSLVENVTLSDLEFSNNGIAGGGGAGSTFSFSDLTTTQRLAI